MAYCRPWFETFRKQYKFNYRCNNALCLFLILFFAVALCFFKAVFKAEPNALKSDFVKLIIHLSSLHLSLTQVN